MSIEGKGHFFTIYFPGFVCFVLYLAKISGERLQDHWSSGLTCEVKNIYISFMALPRMKYRYFPLHLIDEIKAIFNKKIEYPLCIYISSPIN